MTRTARRQSSTDIYHVIIRGIDRMRIFEEDDERSFFLSYLGTKVSEFEGDLYAWCLMGNHVHLLIRMELVKLSKLMQGLNTTYALFFNQRHGRCGHLLQERFWSEPVESDAYFLTVIRYIHQNPVKAFMVPDCRYKWSSYDWYVSERSGALLEPSLPLAMFGGLEGFLEFHKVVALEDSCLEIVLDISDSEAVEYAERLLGEGAVGVLKNQKDKLERNRHLRILKNCMLPTAQVARITGLSYKVVQRA